MRKLVAIPDANLPYNMRRGDVPSSESRGRRYGIKGGIRLI
jgi:hypothetical protein